jgi:putative FmdB family regulatory protein
MPTYDYRCTQCGHVFELFHSIKDDTVKHCPQCDAPAERVPSGGAGLLFKGSGFYITDYRSKSYRDKAKAESSGGGSEGGKGGKGDGGAKKESKPSTPSGD